MKRARISLLFLLFISCQAVADTIEEVTESYTDMQLSEGEPNHAENFHGILGAGVFTGERILGEGGRWTLPLPLVVMRYRDLAYWSITGGGVWLVQSDDHTARFGIGMRSQSGWKPGDDAMLAGMERRIKSIDGYLNASWRTSVATIGAHYYHDIGGASHGDSASLRLSHSFLMASGLLLTPSLSTTWLDNKRVDYYYGVRSEEATPWRPVYAGSATFNTSVGVSGLYRLPDDWVLLGGVVGTHLGNEIVDSPIVSRRYSGIIYAGAGWHF